MKSFKKRTGLLVWAFVMLITCLSIVKAALPFTSVSLTTEDGLWNALVSDIYGIGIWSDIKNSLNDKAGTWNYSIVDNTPRFFIWWTDIEQWEYQVDIEYDGYSNLVVCKSKIFGYYYNPSFLENKLLPLNSWTKAVLEGMSLGENSYIAWDIEMTWWLYINCENSEWHLGTGAVFWSIKYTHNNDGEEKVLYLLAWISGLQSEYGEPELVDELYLLTGLSFDLNQWVIYTLQSNVTIPNNVQVYGKFFDSISNELDEKSTIKILQFEKDVPADLIAAWEAIIQWFNGATWWWWLSNNTWVLEHPEDGFHEVTGWKVKIQLDSWMNGKYVCAFWSMNATGSEQYICSDNVIRVSETEWWNTGEWWDDEWWNTGEWWDDEWWSTGEWWDTWWHGSAQYIIEFQRDVPSTWSKTWEVTIKRNQSGHRKWRRLSSSNTPNDFPDPYESVENDTITISLTSWMNNKYICAFLRTWSDPLITGCSANRVRIDNENPELDLLSPNNRDFYSWYSIEFIWSGSDSVSWISWYVLTIYNPAWSQAYSRELSSNVTWYDYAVNEAGTWRWKVKACDRAVNCVEKSENFVVLYTWNVDYTWWFYLIRPMLWDKINLWNNITFSRNPWSQNSGYVREVSKVWWSTISWSTTSYSVTLNSWNFTTGTYFWSVYDKASGNSDVVPVFYVVDNGNNPDLKVNEFAFENKEYAEADKDYISNTIEIRWMTEGWYTLAYLEDSRGALYINWTFVWSRWYVKNGDDVSIELKASSRHWQTVESILVVWTWSDMVRWSYKVTTEEGVGNWESSSLSPLQKLRGVVFVDSLVELYQYNEWKLATFLSTFMQILEDKIDEYNSLIEEAEQYWEDDLAAEYKLYKNALAFLYTLVEYRYDSIEVEERTVYIAPNGRQYLVEYDETRMAYTSPDFVTRKYFPTWESFTNHIDKNNPKGGNWWIVWNVITTHNWKVYTIYETNGKWTSSNFRTAKYFDTKEDIINHILANNPASDWDHKIDTDFIQVSYTAPNGKIYRIFKTSDEWHNPNMYSSYDFVNAKYFTSLEAAKKYINQNNKK